MSKYMVRCDMEGASGVVSYSQVRPGPEYAEGHRLFMSDLLALLAGLSDGGADEVVVYDVHTHGRNVDMVVVPDFASVICGKPPYRVDWPGGLDPEFDGLILLGAHAMAGTAGALMPHTYWGDVTELRVNGQAVGEIAIEAAVAGDLGVPLVLVTGDSAGVAESAALRAGSLGVVVKDSLGQEAALCYPVPVTTALIRRAARQVVENPPEVEPCRVVGPVTLELDLRESERLGRLRELPQARIDSGCTLVVTAPTLTAAWAACWRQMIAEPGDRG